MPYNSYTEELYNVGKQGGFSEASNFEPSIKNYLKVTTCDIDGDFEFDNLPNGKWLLYTFDIEHLMQADPKSWAYNKT